MARSLTLESKLAALIEALDPLPTALPTALPLERFRADVKAAIFHLQRREGSPVIVALIGGTGTGKSTLFNRILQSELTATSFRRTFTAGAVAAAASEDSLPKGWLDLHAAIVDPANLPAKGQPDLLMLVTSKHPLLRRIVLIDTPDLDGDQPLHHVQADRVFRWADAALFLVTPEKYQMTELLPYYRLAARYGITSLFAMNKAESREVVEDFAQQLKSRGDDSAGRLFALPRDDAGYEPPAEMSLASLRSKLGEISLHVSDEGNARRVADLMERLRDQVISPLRRQRQEADKLIASLRSMETPVAGVDVNPLMSALQRRMQQRSILYLIGPGRMLDRVRQVPGIIARLPRSTWDLFKHGQTNGSDKSGVAADGDRAMDIRGAIADQFTIVQSRIDDLLRSGKFSAVWTQDAAAGYAETKISAEQAARIADEELESLKQWMNQRWNATPRDTAILKKLIAHLPGGEKLTALSEAAPYLVIAASAVATHALFGTDILVFGGYSLVTWLTEKVSNEVASRARMTNQRIANRFARLTHAQIQKSCQWIESRVPASASLDQIQALADGISQQLETS